MGRGTAKRSLVVEKPTPASQAPPSALPAATSPSLLRKHREVLTRQLLCPGFDALQVIDEARAFGRLAVLFGDAEQE